MSSTSYDIGVPLLILGLLWIIRAIYHARMVGRPGPPGLPFIGNLHQVTSDPCVQFTQWAKQYGDVFFLRMGSVDWMIVNSPQAMHDVLVKQGATFANRPHQELAVNILSDGQKGVVLSNYEAEMRIRRKILIKSLSKMAVKGYTGLMTFEARDVCRALLREDRAHGPLGAPVHEVFLWHNLNITLSLTFGTRLASYLDPRVEKHSTSIQVGFQSIDPFFYPGDLLPILRPFLGSKRKIIQDVHEWWIRFRRQAFDQYLTNRDRVDAAIPTTLCRNLADAIEANEITLSHAYILLGEVMAGGLHTSSFSLTWFTQLLAAHPKVQAKAHAEIDRVIGRNRMPTLEDIPHLPYFRCLLQEVLRFRGPFVFNLPHAAMEDTVYRGFEVKKGTWVIPNLHAAHGQLSKQKDAEEFRPERWQTSSKSLAEETLGSQGSRENWAFGGGRRLCVGLHVADTNLSLTCLHLLWSFTLRLGKNEVFSKGEVDGSMTAPPVHHRIQCTPRGPHVYDLLQKDQSISPAEVI
ncbi:MAG: cytochrome P450 [Piptocephalis tieghemiana]|nr:MAG: cytochrome P450 [Piptocephalis tieghemiana]